MMLDNMSSMSTPVFPTLWLSVGYRPPHFYTAALSLPLYLHPLKACLHTEGHMDDGLTLQRCQHEESRAARIIRNTTLLFNHFVRYAKQRGSAVSVLLRDACSGPVPV